jgi:hypothetical protein
MTLRNAFIQANSHVMYDPLAHCPTDYADGLLPLPGAFTEFL